VTAAGPPAQRGSELPFPSAVLAGRVRRVQARLRADGLAGALLFDPENIYYCRRILERAGLGRGFAHRTGYAVGIGFPPNWSEGKTLALRPGEPTPLRPGMTFHVVPTVFDGGIGVCLSETVAVTARGVEVITRFPRDLVTV
jgi:Xaa-Pro aminopeptidase